MLAAQKDVVEWGMEVNKFTNDTNDINLKDMNFLPNIALKLLNRNYLEEFKARGIDQDVLKRADFGDNEIFLDMNKTRKYFTVALETDVKSKGLKYNKYQSFRTCRKEDF